MTASPETLLVKSVKAAGKSPEAAWARSEGRDVKRLAPMSKYFACKTFRDVTVA